MMGAPKGSKNAKAYHEARVREICSMLACVLKDIKNTGVVFMSITSLSKFVAGQLGVSDVNLRRNSKYRRLLDDYLIQQRGAASVLSMKDQKILKLKGKLLASELERSNLKVKLAFAEAVISKNALSAIPASPDCNIANEENTQWRQKFECTANLVLVLMQHASGFAVDNEKGLVIDTASASGDEPIAGPNICRHFVEWCKSNELS